jgi:hypothetical protein
MKTRLIILTLFTAISFIGLAQQSKYDSLDVVIKGSVSIYRSKTLNFYIERNDTLVYLPPMTQKIVEVNGERKMFKTFSYRGILTYYLLSCPKLKPLIQKTQLNENELINIIKRYYNCKGEQAAFTENKNSRRSVRIGFNAGMLLSNLSLKGGSEFNEAKFDLQPTVTAGISFELLNLKQGIAFGNQLNVMQFNFTGKSSTQIGSTKVISDFKNSHLAIQDKLYLKKYFGQKDSKFFVKAGPLFFLNSNFNSKWTKTEISNATQTVIVTSPFLIGRSVSASFHGGIGFEKQLNEKMSLSFESTYDGVSQINREKLRLPDDVLLSSICFQFTLLYKIK